MPHFLDNCQLYQSEGLAALVRQRTPAACCFAMQKYFPLRFVVKRGSGFGFQQDKTYGFKLKWREFANFAEKEGENHRQRNHGHTRKNALSKNLPLHYVYKNLLDRRVYDSVMMPGS